MEIHKISYINDNQPASPLKNHTYKESNSSITSNSKNDTVRISDNAQYAHIFNTFINQLEQPSNRMPGSEITSLEDNISVKKNHSSAWKMGDLALGEMFFGKALLDEWASKGLHINEDTIRKAGQAFNEAFRIYANSPDKSHIGPSLDRHGLVANNQEVPAWFNDEHIEWLSYMPEDARKAFNAGSYYHLPSKNR